MKALRVIEYDGANGLIWLVSGLIGLALALTGTDPGLDTFALVLGGALVIGVALMARWLHAKLRECPDAPAGVIETSRFELAWRVLLGALPAALIVYLASDPIAATWVIAAGYIAVGVLMLSTAVRASRIERRRGGRLVRIDNRFYVAH